MLSNPPGFPLWEVSSLVFFAIPMAVMIILYGRMGLQIRFRSKHTSVLGKLIELPKFCIVFDIPYHTYNRTCDDGFFISFSVDDEWNANLNFRRITFGQLIRYFYIFIIIFVEMGRTNTFKMERKYCLGLFMRKMKIIV